MKERKDIANKVTIKKNNQRKAWCRIIIIGLLLLCGIGFYINARKNIDRTTFISFDEFCEAGGVRYGNLPEGASDIHYYLSKTIMYKKSIYSFVLEDEKEYDSFMEKRKDASCPKSEAVHPYWELYGNQDYTENELEEMKYLEENYGNMDYKEILSISRNKKGFINGYGAFVKDFCDLDYSLANFPQKLPFSEVISDQIEDYTILYYYPQGTGAKTEGMLVNEDTHCFVVYYFGGIR